MLAFASPLVAQDWVAGASANSSTAFTYLTHYFRHPLTRTTQLVYFQTISYLTYEINDAGHTTRVNSPGVSAGAEYRYDERRVTAGVGGGWEFRWNSRDLGHGASVTESVSGPIAQADVGMHFTQATFGRVAASYGNANRWHVVSADLRQDVAHRFRIGPEVLWEGNDDIDVTSFGVLFEIPLQRNALDIRGGQSHVTNRDGTKETHPYFSIGVVVPF